MTSSSSLVIDFQHADVYQGQTKILHDINWQVRPDEHWFVLGPNGCGKSTLMNLVMAYKFPAVGGQATVLGHRFGACVTQELRQKIGWISAYLQDWTYTNMKVLDAVVTGFDASIGLYRDPTPAEWDKARARLGDYEASHLADRLFGELSSGEQMKVLLSRATVHQPRMLVLDEPCCHLDLRTREHFLDRITAVAAQPQAPLLIMVTHRVEDIIPAFTHGLVIRDGRIIATGPKEEVLQESILQAAFEVPVRLHRTNGRYWPWLAP
jgi:iron complex transport system ATP-binding protein